MVLVYLESRFSKVWCYYKAVTISLAREEIALFVCSGSYFRVGISFFRDCMYSVITGLYTGCLVFMLNTLRTLTCSFALFTLNGTADFWLIKIGEERALYLI